MIHWLRQERKPILYVAAPPMSEREIAAAFRVHENHPLFKAVLQIIDEELRAVREIATQSVKDHGILASWVGGMEILERVRTRIIEQRANAIGVGEVK